MSNFPALPHLYTYIKNPAIYLSRSSFRIIKYRRNVIVLTVLMVPEVGLEPTRCYPLDFESSASAIPPLRRIGTFVIIQTSLNNVNLFFIFYLKYFELLPYRNHIVVSTSKLPLLYIPYGRILHR